MGAAAKNQLDAAFCAAQGEEKRESKAEANTDRKQARQEAKRIVDEGAQEKRLAQIKRDAETALGDSGQ